MSEHMSGHANGEHHLLPLKVYFFVWAALVVLTGVTVGAAYYGGWKASPKDRGSDRRVTA